MFLCSHNIASTYSLLILQVLTARLLGAIDEVYFSDPKRGRISWVIEQNSLPWSGQYYFTEAHGLLLTELLVVVDSSNGNHLGNCVSFLPRDEEWRRFYWVLTEDALICNLTYTEVTVSKVSFPPSAPPRTFSVRILAAQGPRCFRDLIVQNEKMEDCPPSLKRNSFQQMSLECGCDSSNSIHQSLSAVNSSTNRGTFNSANPNTFFFNEKSAVFPNLRISPIPQQSKDLTTESPVTVTTVQPSFTTTVSKWTTLNNVGGRNDGLFIGNISQNLTDENQQNLQYLNDLHQKFVEQNVQRLSSLQSIDNESRMVRNEEYPQTSNGSFASHTLNAHPCANIHCQNNGTCVLGGDGKALCMCSVGYIGSFCEVNMCADYHCQNGGICYVIDKSPQCQCTVGTSGPYCEQVLCNPTCEQGGTCVLYNGQPVCHCLPGFTGVNCNIRDICTINSAICLKYGKEARCQLDPQSYILVSPVVIDATYKCLCENSTSEWIECGQLISSQSPATVPSITVSPKTHVKVPGRDNAELLKVDNNEQEKNEDGNGPSLHALHTVHTQNLFPNTANGDTNSVHRHELLNGSKNGDTVKYVKDDESTRDALVSGHLEEADSDLLSLIATTLSTTTFPEMHFLNAMESTSRWPSLDSNHSSNHHSLHTYTDKSGSGLAAEKSGEVSITAGDVSSRFANPKSNLKVVVKPSAMSTKIPKESEIGTQVRTTQKAHILHSGKPSVLDVTGILDVTMSSTDSQHEESDNSVHATTEIQNTDGYYKETKPTAHISDDNEVIDGRRITVSSSLNTETVSTTDFIEQTVSTTREYPLLSDYDDQVKFVKITVGLPSTPVPVIIQGNRIANSNESSSKSGNSWAIILSVTLVFLILAAVCGLLIFRYIRRSRKLHGKYNPAREENALSGNYAMPMTTVAKEERLI